ncbi:growth arrest-specific protein 7-like [Sebastes umbrosus]|uniref:growth arrest-specific protein 7-like n=1 Tax=Sebastes umbrosus TaxID=72105 RepID=UPI00189FAEE0|nr:growth arrest-specific protein 7-like [Sebastes umbrosus]
MKPAVVNSAAAREETDSCPLPPGWRSYTSPEGLRYYVNSCSKETTWRRPSLSAEAPQRPLAQQNASPYGNGCHSSTKTSQPTEVADVALRKPTMNKQFPSQS